MMRRLTAVVLLLLVQSQASGQVSWEPIGPGAGSFLMSVAIDPTDSDVMYIGGDIEGVYKTTDGGQSWLAASQGLNGGNRPAGVYAIQELVIDPTDSQTLYACTWAGLFKSTDAAGEWTWIFPTDQTEDDDPTPVSYVAVDPQDGQVLYFGIGDADANSDGRGEVYRSLDGGTTWSEVTTDMPADAVVHGILIDPTSSSESRQIFISTDVGVYRSQDGGSSWGTVNTGLPHTDARRLEACTVDGQLTLFLGLHTQGNAADPSSFRGGIYKSTDDGDTWVSVTGDLPASAYDDPEDPPPLYDYWRFVVHPAAPNTLYAGTNLGGWGDLWGVHKTTDGGTSWTKVDAEAALGWMASPWWNDANITLLGISPSNPDVLIAGGDFLIISTDAGATWEQAYTQQVGSAWSGRGVELMESYSQAYHPTDPDVLYIGYDDMGLWRSDDGGSSFLRLDAVQKPDGFDSVNSIVIDPDTDALYIARDCGENDADLDPQYSIGTILRSSDRGVTWTDIGGDLPEGRSTLVMDTTSSSAARVLYASIYGHGVYKTVDGGENWSAANNGLGDGASLAWSLALDPSQTQSLYLGLNSLSGSGGGCVYRSTDGAESWTKVDAVCGYDILSVAVSSSGSVFVGATDDHSWSMDGGLFRSTDRGETWQKVLDQPRVGLVLTQPQDSQVVLAASQPWWNFVTDLQAGLYRSDDGGTTWDLINGDLGHTFVLTGAMSPHNAGQVVVGTHGGGVWLGETQAPVTTLTGDFDGDGKVGFPDFLEFIAGFGKSLGDQGYSTKYDLDADGKVNFQDFLIFAGMFGKTAE